MKLFWKPLLPPFAKHKKALHHDPVATGHFIYQIGEAAMLRQPSRTVDPTGIATPLFQQKIAYVRKCMLDYRKLTHGKGRGIAAVQVGIPETFFVVFMPERKEKVQVFINPVIEEKSAILFRYPEMCMSCNNLIAPVVRPSWITFTYLDAAGQTHEWTRKDTTKQGRMYNRVFQHEIDHLHGIINIDMVSSKELTFLSDKSFYAKARFEKIS